MRNANDSGLSLCADEYYIIYTGNTLLDRDIEKLFLCLSFLPTVSLLSSTVTHDTLSGNSSSDKILNLNEA